MKIVRILKYVQYADEIFLEDPKQVRPEGDTLNSGPWDREQALQYNVWEAILTGSRCSFPGYYE